MGNKKHERGESNRMGAKGRAQEWSERDLQILRDFYPVGGTAAAREELGGTRSDVAIRLRAAKEGLEAPTRWSAHDVAALRALIRDTPRQTVEEISERIGRTPSAIRQKVRALDLQSQMGGKPLCTREQFPRTRPSSSGRQGHAASRSEPRKKPRRYTTAVIDQALEASGSERIKGEVDNRESKVWARCQCGQEVEKTAHDWMRTPGGCTSCRPRKCREAQDWNRLELAAKISVARGAVLPAQTNPRTLKMPILWQCVQGHLWESPLCVVKLGHWCPRCRPLLLENAVRSILEGVLGATFDKARPRFLEGLELDGYNEALRLAFEYDGEFHRTPVQMARDARKRVACQQAGVRLVEVNHEDGALGIDGIRRAVEREVNRLGLEASMSVWDIPVELTDATVHPRHRKAFERKLKSWGCTWDANLWRGVDAKVPIDPMDGGPLVEALPRTVIQGRRPGRMAGNSKLTFEAIEARLAALGWSWTRPDVYRCAGQVLDLIAPDGAICRMTWNAWQSRVERILLRELISPEPCVGAADMAR